MIDLNILKRAALAGVLLAVALVTGGHLLPRYRPGLLFGCMLIAGLAGLLYARDLGRGYGAGVFGGALAGAACGIAAVALASLLGDRPDLFLPYGVMVSALTGFVGGLFGQLDARMREKLAALKNPE